MAGKMSRLTCEGCPATLDVCRGCDKYATVYLAFWGKCGKGGEERQGREVSWYCLKCCIRDGWFTESWTERSVKKVTSGKWLTLWKGCKNCRQAVSDEAAKTLHLLGYELEKLNEQHRREQEEELRRKRAVEPWKKTLLHQLRRKHMAHGKQRLLHRSGAVWLLRRPR